ncbi:MAG: polymerase sigma-70 factor, subfamily [Actinomycetota bacterium]|nr:polymerase sigma-70 factor, subfamily [Actinomycetota bacterium]
MDQQRSAKRNVVVDLRGDPGANNFDDWYRAHRDQLVGYCARFLHDEAAAADVAQEALFRAWAHRDAFTSGDQVRPWLWRVARNLCIDTIRLRQRALPSAAIPDRPAGDAADPTRPIEADEDRRTVRAALDVLSPRHRDLLVRREVYGVGYEDLAEELGVSVEGARAVVFRARRCLQHHYTAMREMAVA